MINHLLHSLLLVLRVVCVILLLLLHVLLSNVGGCNIELELLKEGEEGDLILLYEEELGTREGRGGHQPWTPLQVVCLDLEGLL